METEMKQDLAVTVSASLLEDVQFDFAVIHHALNDHFAEMQRSLETGEPIRRRHGPWLSDLEDDDWDDWDD
jgi:hypothetical protein